ncbi:MAG: ROK family protein [Acidobacteriota bacterium]
MEILGIDVGGSGIKGAPVALEKGELLEERLRIPTPQPSDPASVAETVKDLAAHFSWRGPIGCGFPAAVQHGIARTAANVDDGWIGTDIALLLGEATGCPVRALNDADAAGLAEMAHGAGRGRLGTVIMVTIGTGLGTAIFIDGRLLPNTELGHLELDGREAEVWASGAVRKRDGLSWKAWGARFDAYLGALERLFWPDLFIIGGGASKKHEKFFPYLSARCEIVPAQLRNDAGIIGAALAAQPHG